MKSIWYVLCIAILFVTIGQVASDLYLPSLSAITVGMHTNTHFVRLTVFMYMVGFAVSRLIYGPVSDAIGRKRPLIIGLFLCFLGSTVCVFSYSIGMLIFGRFLQGVGSGAGVVLGGAIVRDLLDGKEVAKTYSYMGIANVALIASAPFVGGYLQYLFGWRASFIFITLYVLAMLLVCIFVLEETNQYRTLENLKIANIKSNLCELFANKKFIFYGVCIFSVYGAILSWLTSGPILLENTVGISPVDFGWVSLISGLFYAAGAFMNGKLVGIYGINSMLRLGACAIFLSGMLMLVFFLLHFINLWSIVVPIAVFLFGASIIFPNAFAGALIPFKKIAGIAGTIIGFMQISGGSFASGIASMLPDNTQLPLAVIFVLCGVIVLVFSFKLLIHDTSDATNL